MIELHPIIMSKQTKISMLFYSILSGLICFFTGFILSPFFSREVVDFTKNFYSSIPFNALSIFLNNLSIAIFMIAGGIVYGIPTLIFGVQNFFVLGVLSRHFIEKMGLNFYLLSLLPHGVIEIPAMIISFYYGIKVCYLRLVNTPPPETSRIIRKAVFNITPLFFFAAIVEVYITPVILTYFNFVLKF